MKKILFALMLTLISFPAFAAEKESVYDRVMKSNTLRCGYWNWEPLYIVNAKTDETSGIFKDVMSELGRISGLKIEWTSEVRFEDFVTDLNSGKIDAVCAGIWPSAMRAKYIRFSEPVFFIPMNVYKRIDDRRFDLSPESLNDPAVSVAVMDGEMSSEIRGSDFPLSTAVTMPQMAGTGSELLLNVTTKKSDVTFTDAVSGSQFMKKNPGKVRPVKLATPLRLMPNTIGVAGDEERLQTFLNASLQQLQNSGAIERILRRYDDAYPGTLARQAKSYEVKK